VVGTRFYGPADLQPVGLRIGAKGRSMLWTGRQCSRRTKKKLDNECSRQTRIRLCRYTRRCVVSVKLSLKKKRTQLVCLRHVRCVCFSGSSTGPPECLSSRRLVVIRHTQ